MIIPILKVGEFNGVEITREILEEIVKNYDPNYLKAPIKLGHQDNNQTALGYVEDLFLINDVLYAQINPSSDLIELLNDKKVLSVSAEIRNEEGKGWYLIGLAFLGTDLPAVKGLPLYFKEQKIINFKEQLKTFTTKKFISELDVVDEEWDGDKAKKEIRDKYDWETLSKCVCYVITEDGELPENLQNYKYPFAQVKGDKIVINKKAVASIKAFLNGAMGNKQSEKEKELVSKVLKWLEDRISEVESEEMSEVEKLKEENQRLKEEIERMKIENELSKLNLSEKDKKDYLEILIKLSENDRNKLIEKLKVQSKSKAILMSESYKRNDNEDNIKELWKKGLQKIKKGG